MASMNKRPEVQPVSQTEDVFQGAVIISLRIKLMAAFFIVSVLAAGIIAFFSYYGNQVDFSDRAGANLKTVAEAQGAAIGDLLARQLNTLQALAVNRSMQNLIASLNESYTDDPTVIEARLKSIDQEWQAAAEGDPVIQARLNNLLARELTSFRAAFPDYAEVFVTDRYGAVAAATSRTSDYYQGDEAWWKGAFNRGQGAVYIGPPAADESGVAFGLAIAVPVYAPGSDEVAGVLRATYRIEPILAILGKARVGKTGHADLFMGDGRSIRLEEGVTLVTAEPETMARLEAAVSEGYGEFVYEGALSLVSQAPVAASTGEAAVSELGWRVVMRQTRQEALAPVAEQVATNLWLGLAIVVGAAVVAVVIGQVLTRPITRLTRVAQQITVGELNVQAEVESRDEIGQLAVAFNTMTERLRETIDTLEEQVADRTQQLETLVVINQRLTGILDLSDLLRQVVTITKETFDYYHVHIYLVDERQENLSMAEGYGEPGAEMKRRGHAIPLNAPRSLVARAAREGRMISVENVADDPHWLPNELLPETKAEMAVPIMLGHEVVGVLDVQSAVLAGLTGRDEATLQALANQVATAVRNARLFTQTQEALYEAQKLQRIYTGQAWARLGAARATTNYEFRLPTLPPLEEVATPEAEAALQQEQTVELRRGGQRIGKGTDGERGHERHEGREGRQRIGNGTDGEHEGHERREGAYGHNAVATPLKLRDQIIGVLGVQTDQPARQWTEDEIALIESVSEQMTLAIENARLFEETGRRAGREKIIADMTHQVWASGKIERVMQAVVQQLGMTLNASKVVIRLGTEDQLIQHKESQQ